MDAIPQPARGRLARLPPFVALPLVALLWGAPAAAQDAVLMTSTVPGYRPGMPVSLGDRLSVPEGGRVALLFRSGQVLRVGGPVEAVLELPSLPRRDGLAAALGEALRLRGVDASVIGATRAGQVAAPARPRDIQVDPARGATWCLGPADRIWLKRASTGEASEWTLSRGRLRRYLAWPVEADRIAWPDDVPVSDGDAFELAMESGRVGSLLFRRVAAGPEDDPAEVAEGMLHGCHQQYAEALQRIARRMSDR